METMTVEKNEDIRRPNSRITILLLLEKKNNFEINHKKVKIISNCKYYYCTCLKIRYLCLIFSFTYTVDWSIFFFIIL